jgi:hypothetical protein
MHAVRESNSPESSEHELLHQVVDGYAVYGFFVRDCDRQQRIGRTILRESGRQAVEGRALRRLGAPGNIATPKSSKCV